VKTHTTRRLTLLLATLIATAGCTPQAGTGDAGYRTIAASPRNIVIAVEAAGTVEPVTTVEVKSKASGEILELAVATGDRVNLNDLLVVIDQRIPRNAVAQADANLEVAKARLDHARAQLNRMRELHTRSSVANVDFERAELDLANARAEVVRAEVALETARIQMDDTKIRAPISGTVIQRLAERGQVISSPVQDFGGGSVLLQMAELSTVRVRALFDETDIGKIRPGIAARVSVSAYPNRTFEGHVLKIEPQATVVQNVTMFPVLVDLDNADGLLMPGMNATVNIDIARRQGTLAIPNSALRTPVDAALGAQLLGLPGEVATALFAQARPRDGQDGTRTAAMGLENGPPDFARMRAIRDKMQRGDELSDEEQQLVATMRTRMQQVAAAGGGGPGGGFGGAFGGFGGAGGEGMATPPTLRRSALDGQLSGRYVVFVERPGGPEAVLIETGITDLDYTEVIAGLAEGDRVFLLPSASLQRAQEMFTERMNRMTTGIPGMPGGSRGAR
jgi:HlyD family secretion protein